MTDMCGALTREVSMTVSSHCILLEEEVVVVVVHQALLRECL